MRIQRQHYISIGIKLEKDDYFEDQLPLSLRALPFKSGYEAKVRIWDSLNSSHGQVPAAVADVATMTDNRESNTRQNGDVRNIGAFR